MFVSKGVIKLMKKEYEKDGYFVIKNFLTDKERLTLLAVLTEFHRIWKEKNACFYAEKAINSAYLTAKEYLNDRQRQVLFAFIGSTKLMNIVNQLIPKQPCFLNTQLFFNPLNKQQPNYWHRDPQYHLSLEQQQAALLGPEVIHFRFAIFDEPGVELIAGSHQRWDTEAELNVRLEQNGCKNNQPLSQGKTVKLLAGDLLVFSANIIHRGLYGMDRLSFDVLFCQPEPSVLQFVNDDCLPESDTLSTLENHSAFSNTLIAKNKA